MWKHAPAAYGPPKTLYNRWKQWSRMGVFATIMTELAARDQETGIMLIDATQAKAIERPKAWRLKKGARTADWTDQGQSQTETACHG
jgi:transposase